MIPLIAHRPKGLGGQHDVVPSTGNRPTDQHLRLPLAVDVGGVEDIDAGIERGIDDRGCLVLGGVAERAEVHGAQREGADLDSGTTQCAVLHGCPPR